MPRVGRPPRTRTDYFADAQNMMTLCRAIENDKSRPEDWRKRVIQALGSIAKILIDAPPAEEVAEPASDG